MAKGTARQQHPILVKKTPVHSITSIDIFTDGMGHEAHWGKDRDLAAKDIGLINNPAHAAKVITMGMGIDHGRHRTGTELLVDKVESSPGRFLRGQRVKNNPALLALDKRNIG